MKNCEPVVDGDDHDLPLHGELLARVHRSRAQLEGSPVEPQHHRQVVLPENTRQYYYRPQRSCGKVMFSQASVILFTGGCGRHPAPLWSDTLQTDTPRKIPHPTRWLLQQTVCIWAYTRQADTPRQTPPGQTPPPLWEDTHQADTPLCRHSWVDTLPPRADIPPSTPRWLLQRTVRILLECILVPR